MSQGDRQSANFAVKSILFYKQHYLLNTTVLKDCEGEFNWMWK